MCIRDRANTNPDSATYSAGGTYQINASTNGDGTLGYATSSPGCSVDPTSGLITISGAGACVVTITATGGANFADATAVTFTLNVGQAAQAITVANTNPDSCLLYTSRCV